MDEKEEQQETLAERVILKDRFGDLKAVAGVDSAYLGGQVVSGAILMKHGQVVEHVYSVKDLAFPYRPTFRMFTEGPSMVDAVKKLSIKPDLLFVKGHGIAHPRRAGLACYVGVLADIPTIGIAKNHLSGEYRNPLHGGEDEPLILKKEQLGWVVKTQKTFSPIFISPGHRVSVRTSLELSRGYVKKGKLPEPLEQAHQYVNKVKNRIEEHAQRDNEGMP